MTDTANELEKLRDILYGEQMREIRELRALLLAREQERIERLELEFRQNAF